ncbi:MAG: hypothetical protein U0Q15_10675 [Kineosporiaceae bacterium]
MTESSFYPRTRADFALIAGAVSHALQVDARLPEWTFTAESGKIDICQFGVCIEGPFGRILQHLVDEHGDVSVSLMVLSPEPEYYRQNYGSFPAFTIPAESVEEGYWDAVVYEPNGDPTGAVGYTANVVGIAGSSGMWAVWGERRWDIAMILSQTRYGGWLTGDVAFVDSETALSEFTEPDFKTPLSVAERETFLSNVRARGTFGEMSG